MERAQVELRSGRVLAPALSSRRFCSDARRRASSSCFSRALRFAFLPFVFASRARASDQGLTLVHFSAQRERFLWNRGCVERLFRGCSWGDMGCHGVSGDV